MSDFKCPSCSSSLHDSFGLTKCPNCGALAFVEMDGIVRQADESEADVASDESTVPPENLVSDESQLSAPGSVWNAVVEDVVDNEVEPELEVDSEQETFGGFEESTGLSIVSDVEDFEVPQDPTIVAEEELGGGAIAPENFGIESGESVEAKDPSDLSEISDFGNSDLSSTPGSFYYRVTIKGIDSKDVKDTVVETLDDVRFGWKKEDILSLIKNGEIHLSKINAVKASVMVNSLKSLPLDISWEQVSLVDENA